MKAVDHSSHPASDRIAERVTAAAEVAIAFASLLDRDSVSAGAQRGTRLDIAIADERQALFSTLVALLTGLIGDRAEMATRRRQP